MSTFDESFDPAIRHYIEMITHPEPPLQAEIRSRCHESDIPEKMLIGPVEGQFLHFLVKIAQPERCLEIGTCLGYSALFIASALPPGGTLITCEIDPVLAQKAQDYFNTSPYGSAIQLLVGDAYETVPSLTGEFDCIFLDAHQAQYPKYYELCLEKLRQGGFMIVDNALRNAEVLTPQSSKFGLAVDAFNRTAKSDPRVETVLLSVRDGVLLLRKI